MKSKMNKPLGHRLWFKVLLTLLLCIPVYSQMGFDPAKTSDVISAVLTHPLIYEIHWVLPIAKVLLFTVILLAFLSKTISQRLLLWYYTILLIATGFFQNTACTSEYGFAWVTGNTLVQLSVAAFCFYDVMNGKTVFFSKNLNQMRLWVILPMVLAFLMPYATEMDGRISAALTIQVLFNEAGVTYCMITPIIIGMLLLFSKGVYKPTMSVICYVGLMFGLLNILTWFVFRAGSFWMGILHLPLLILSVYGLIVVQREQII